MSRIASGSVFQIGTGKHAGKWAADVVGADGKRHRRLAPTKRAAEMAKREMLADTDNGVRPAGGLTVREHVESWLLFTAKPSVRPSTLEAYKHKLDMLMPIIGARPLAKLEPAHLRAAYAQLATKGHPSPSPKRKPKPGGLSSTSIRNAHVVLKAALQQAFRDGLTRRNVADLVTPPKRAAFEPQPFTRAEALVLLDAIRTHRHGPLWLFMLGTGVRIGEAAALTMDDVDLPRRSARIAHTITRTLVRPGVRKWERTPVKTNKSRRAIALPSLVLVALQSQRALVAALRLKAGPAWTDHDFVFPSDTGQPLRANHVLESWHAALRHAGLDKRRLHDLRSSTATLLFGDGFETRAVSDLLGHASTSMTEGRYIGSVPAMLTRAAERLDEILSPDSLDEEAAE